VLAALLQRTTTGEGQHLDVAMGQASVYVNEWAAVGLQPPVDEYGGFDTWNHHTYPLGDGSFVALVGNPVNLFPLWVERLGGSADLIADPRFAALDDPRLLASHVRSVADLADTEWAVARRLTVEVAPGLPVPAAPWQTSGASIGNPHSIAALGGDNRTVLSELGYSDDDIDALREAGVLCG
jgi:crotonobetainyl-CoA:carnitine CoA-transferase CaiB-like acyl-CoA transferase